MSTEKLKVNAWPMFKLGLKTFLTLYNCFDACLLAVSIILTQVSPVHKGDLAPIRKNFCFLIYLLRLHQLKEQFEGVLSGKDAELNQLNFRFSIFFKKNIHDTWITCYCEYWNRNDLNIIKLNVKFYFIYKYNPTNQPTNNVLLLPIIVI